MNVLRKISIDTVLLWLAVALCIAGLVWLGGAHAWITALGVGVFVAAQEAPHATNPPRSCATCSRPLNAWQLRFDGGAELRCGRYDCAAKDKLVATRDADGTVREMVTDPARAPLDLAALRTLAREASERNRRPTSYPERVSSYVAPLAAAVEQLTDALEAKTPTLIREARARDAATYPGHAAGHEWVDGYEERYHAMRGDVPALYDQIERQAAEIERLKAQRGLTSEEMAIIEQTRALVRERDELRASVELLDEQGRKMKAERDAALLEVAALKLSVGASRSAFADGEAHERRKRDVTIERLQGEIDAARAEIERRADPFPLGRGPETCGTHCARCGEKIHLVRPTTGPDREERLENHCCPGGAS